MNPQKKLIVCTFQEKKENCNEDVLFNKNRYKGPQALHSFYIGYRPNRHRKKIIQATQLNILTFNEHSQADWTADTLIDCLV